ncbi:MAG: hypothetical protein O3A46_10645 [Candidatus Poribacteria bacterium]|nr:hypothetical protein [Candidatus Poribacteria bacterium]
MNRWTNLFVAVIAALFLLRGAADASSWEQARDRETPHPEILKMKKSQTPEQPPQIPEDRSPIIAGVLSAFPPGAGLGQFYVGNTGRGKVHLGVMTASVVLWADALITGGGSSGRRRDSERWAQAAKFVYFANALSASFNAPLSAIAQNRERERLLEAQTSRLRIEPAVDGVGVVARLSF